MIIVTTTRRPQGVSYVTDTLRSIGDVGSRRKVLVSDGPLDVDVPDGWEVRQHSWQGARATGWIALQIALDAGVDDMVLCQDDVVICEDGSSVMDTCPVPDNCVATHFYTKHGLPGLQKKNPGQARLVVIGASGTAQAFKMPRRSLEYLCAKDYKKAPNHITDNPHQFDDAMFAFARESPWPHVAHLVPNVVRHVGEVSVCGSRTKFNQPWSVRRGERFPGDVKSLPVFEKTYTHPT